MSLKPPPGASLARGDDHHGLMAGVFGLYAHSIMRGLGSTDDRTFVGAFQAIDRAIINPLFMLTFFGALVPPAWAGSSTSVTTPVGAAVGSWPRRGLYLVVVVITIAVNVPLNDDIKAAGDPDRIADLAAVRDDFHETRWVAWNIVRAVGHHGVRLPHLGARPPRPSHGDRRRRRPPGPWQPAPHPSPGTGPDQSGIQRP